MKNIGVIIIVLFLLTFSAGCTNAQERQAVDQTTINIDAMDILSDNTAIVGNWKINDLIMGNEMGGWRHNPVVDDYEYEYKLTEQDEEYSLGNNAEFKPDNTFTSYYSAWCGNDCFTTTYGTYRFEGRHHVRLILERITVIGACPHSDTVMNKDLGLFCVYKDSTCIKLIPSDGNPAADIRKVEYSGLIDKFDYETSEVHNFIYLPNIPISSTNIQGIAEEYFRKDTSLKPQDINVLYSKIIRGGYCMAILLEEKQTRQHHFLVYFLYAKSAGLYTDEAFRKYFRRSGQDHG